MGPFHQTRMRIKTKSISGDKEAVGLIRLHPEICLETEECWAYSLLHHAAREDRLVVVEELVLNGAQLDAKDRYQQTPLWWACLWGRREVALRLVAHGANPLARANDGTTPYDHWTRRFGETSISILSKPLTFDAKVASSQVISSPPSDLENAVPQVHNREKGNDVETMKIPPAIATVKRAFVPTPPSLMLSSIEEPPSFAMVVTPDPTTFTPLLPPLMEMFPDREPMDGNDNKRFHFFERDLLLLRRGSESGVVWAQTPLNKRCRSKSFNELKGLDGFTCSDAPLSKRQVLIE